MRRILGLDFKGFWHITAHTHGEYMRTECGHWLKMVAVCRENLEDPKCPPTNAPWCPSCVFTTSLFPQGT